MSVTNRRTDIAVEGQSCFYYVTTKVSQQFLCCKLPFPRVEQLVLSGSFFTAPPSGPDLWSLKNKELFRIGLLDRPTPGPDSWTQIVDPTRSPDLFTRLVDPTRGALKNKQLIWVGLVDRPTCGLNSFTRLVHPTCGTDSWSLKNKELFRI